MPSVRRKARGPTDGHFWKSLADGHACRIVDVFIGCKGDRQL